MFVSSNGNIELIVFYCLFFQLIMLTYNIVTGNKELHETCIDGYIFNPRTNQYILQRSVLSEVIMTLTFDLLT